MHFHFLEFGRPKGGQANPTMGGTILCQPLKNPIQKQRYQHFRISGEVFETSGKQGSTVLTKQGRLE